MCEKRDKILYDREERINKVKSVHKLNNDLVLTIKANIPGNNKNIKNSNIIMKYFLAQVLNNFDINSSEKIESHDGDYYIIS